MDLLSWIPGFSFIAGLSSNIVIIALALAGLYFMGPVKKVFDAIMSKVAEYLPGVTDYLAGGAKGLQTLGVASIVVLGITHGATYYMGKASVDCKKQVEASVQDLRQTYKFVKR